MKKTTLSIRAAFMAISSIVLLASFTGANASGGIIPVQLKYIGNMNNQPLFQLTFAGNPEENDFVLSIKDEEGFVLYRENIKEPNFRKKFLLNTEEIGDKTLLFEILSRKSNQVVVYKINRQSRQVDEMLISRL